MKNILPITATIMLASCVAPSVNNKPYPETAKAHFMEGCTKEDPNTKVFCSCAIVELEKTVPLEDLVMIGLSSTKKAMQDRRFTKAIVTCASKLP